MPPDALLQQRATALCTAVNDFIARAAAADPRIFGERITEVLIEEAVAGREITVGILGSRTLPVLEIRPRNAFYDFEAKYTPGMTEYLVPAPIEEGEALLSVPWEETIHVMEDGYDDPDDVRLAMELLRVLNHGGDGDEDPRVPVWARYRPMLPTSTGAAAFHEAAYNVASGEFESVMVLGGERMRNVTTEVATEINTDTAAMTTGESTKSNGDRNSNPVR